MIIETKKLKLMLDRNEKLQSIVTIGLRNALFEIGLDAARSLTDSINNDGRTGRTYFISGNPHVASAPGEFPANRTGKLKKSMNYLVRGVREVEWGSESPYSIFLEEGTENMAPRALIRETAESRGAHHALMLNIGVDDEIKRHS